ncbi:MAG: TlpA family protein disulfide reductase [Abitibacteriaceae bacterium]|nr:TlpA family protein disulfide reductase [Abditibacteriaceae bacterium]MBV9864926.1 TlpA family protein disulfide reductase [Abditibacteriaceae bacterium]
MESPYIQKVYQQSKNRAGLLGIAVNGDTVSDLKEFQARHKVNYPIAIDASDRLFGRFDVAFPSTVLVDRNGVIRLVEEGFVAQEFPKTQARFAALMTPAKAGPKLKASPKLKVSSKTVPRARAKH